MVLDRCLLKVIGQIVFSLSFRRISSEGIFTKHLGQKRGVVYSFLLLFIIFVGIYCGGSDDSGLTSKPPKDTKVKKDDKRKKIKIEIGEVEIGQTVTKKIDAEEKKKLARRISDLSGIEYTGEDIIDISLEANPDFSFDEEKGTITFTPQERKGEKARLRKSRMTITVKKDGKEEKYKLFYSATVAYGHGTNGDEDGDGWVDDEDDNNVQDRLQEFIDNSNSISIYSPGGPTGDGDKVKVTVSLVGNRLQYGVFYKPKTRAEVALLNNSRLGLKPDSHSTYPNFSDSLKMVAVRTAEYYEKWNPIWAEDDEIENSFHELVITVSPSGAGSPQEHEKMDVIFRVYDDGLGFRYRIRGNSADTGSNAENFRINNHDEKTTFNFGFTGARTWNEVIYSNPKGAPAPYENHIHMYPLTRVQDNSGIYTPVTLRSSNSTDSYYVSIHEAGLTPKEMGSMMLKKTSTGARDFWVEFTSNNIFKSNASTGFNAESEATKPFLLPWRSIQVAEGAAGKLIDSRLILNLNDPLKEDAYKYEDNDPDDDDDHTNNPFFYDFTPTFETSKEGQGELDTTWMRPGVYVGYWRGIHLKAFLNPVLSQFHGTGYCWGTCATTNFILDYYKLADELNAGAVLYEGWNGARSFDRWRYSHGSWSSTGLGGTFNLDTLFNTLRATSGSRNINYRRLQEGKLPIYHAMHTECENHYKALHSEIMGWRTPRVRLFEEYRKRSKGMIRYVKGGYVANSASSYVHWSQAWVKHFHRYIKETAKNKINVIIHEPIKATGVRRTYPNMMTREGVAGEEQELINKPDPGIPHQSRLIFQRGLGGPTDYTPGIVKYGETTNAKQLAMMSIIYSPLAMAADTKGHYRNSAYKNSVDFIKNFHSDYSESRVLESEFGRYAVIARRKKDSLDWVVAGLTAGAKTVTVDLRKILEEGAKYTAIKYSDGTSRSKVVREVVREVDRETNIKFAMRSNGGFAMYLEYLSIDPKRSTSCDIPSADALSSKPKIPLEYNTLSIGKKGGLSAKISWNGVKGQGLPSRYMIYTASPKVTPDHITSDPPLVNFVVNDVSTNFRKENGKLVYSLDINAGHVYYPGRPDGIVGIIACNSFSGEIIAFGNQGTVASNLYGGKSFIALNIDKNIQIDGKRTVTANGIQWRGNYYGNFERNEKLEFGSSALVPVTVQEAGNYELRVKYNTRSSGLRVEVTITPQGGTGITRASSLYVTDAFPFIRPAASFDEKTIGDFTLPKGDVAIEVKNVSSADWNVGPIVLVKK